MTRKDKLKAIEKHRGESRYAERICSELTYLDSLSNPAAALTTAVWSRRQTFCLPASPMTA